MKIFFLFKKDTSKDINVKWCTIYKRILDGHPQTCYGLFQMDEQTFVNLCDHLKRHENLKDTRWVTIVEAVVMFLLIAGHNVRMRVVADHFQHSIEIVA